MAQVLLLAGPFVGQGLPGPDPHAFNRQPTNISTGDPTRPGGPLSQPGGGTPEGWTGAGSASAKSFVKAFDAGVEGQSQLINGVPATILTGNGGPARQAGNEAGQMAGQDLPQALAVKWAM